MGDNERAVRSRMALEEEERAAFELVSLLPLSTLGKDDLDRIWREVNRRMEVFRDARIESARIGDEPVTPTYCALRSVAEDIRKGWL